MTTQTKDNLKIVTKDALGRVNGFLIPVYNIHDRFLSEDKAPQQVYVTVIEPRQIKGPHLHYIRTGCFTCVMGNARIVLRTAAGYEVYYSGELHKYRSIIVPTGVPAALQNIGDGYAMIINTPSPAWTPEMNDEYSADFSDFDFGMV